MGLILKCKVFLIVELLECKNPIHPKPLTMSNQKGEKLTKSYTTGGISSQSYSTVYSSYGPPYTSILGCNGFQARAVTYRSIKLDANGYFML